GTAHQLRLRGAQHRLPTDPRALRSGRAGRRHLLLQLPRRLGPVLGRGVRQDRRHLRRPRQGELTERSSWPALPASTSCLIAGKDLDARDERGHDGGKTECPHSTNSPPPKSRTVSRPANSPPRRWCATASIVSPSVSRPCTLGLRSTPIMRSSRRARLTVAHVAACSTASPSASRT